MHRLSQAYVRRKAASNLECLGIKIMSLIWSQADCFPDRSFSGKTGANQTLQDGLRENLFHVWYVLDPIANGVAYALASYHLRADSSLRFSLMSIDRVLYKVKI